MILYKRKQYDTAPCAQPDPYVIFWGGYYYIYATHSEGIQLYRSGNFLDWDYMGFCYQSPSEKEYWAPCVLQWEGAFYMYYSSMPRGNNDTHQQCIRVARASSPEGPFTQAKVLLEPFSIDAHAVAAGSGLYLFYCVNDMKSEYPGTQIVVDKLLSPTEPEGKPAVAVRPTLPEEIFEKNRFGNNKDWYTVEGPCYFYQNGTHYLLFSGSSYENETYFVGYCTAHGKTDDLRTLDWVKYPDNDTYHPLLAKNQFTEGTGHNSLINIDGAVWIVYHGRDIREGTGPYEGDTRTMRADILRINQDELTVEFVT